MIDTGRVTIVAAWVSCLDGVLWSYRWVSIENVFQKMPGLDLPINGSFLLILLIRYRMKYQNPHHYLHRVAWMTPCNASFPSGSCHSVSIHLALLTQHQPTVRRLTVLARFLAFFKRRISFRMLSSMSRSSVLGMVRGFTAEHSMVDGCRASLVGALVAATAITNYYDSVSR